MPTLVASRNMSEFWTKVIDWIKQPPRVVAAIAIACAVILFSPEKAQDAICVTPILKTIGPYIGIVLVLACALLVTSFVSFSYSWSEKQILRLRLKRFRVQSLSDPPSREEGTWLFHLRKTKTQRLPLESGVVAGLEARQIIARATIVSHSGTDFDYNIQPWAWNHLNKNRNLIEE